MASTKSTVVTPVFFLASFSQSPGDAVWWRSSQRSHVFADVNSSTGRSGTCSATARTLRASSRGGPLAGASMVIVFRLRPPDPEHVSHFLARQRTAPLTYAEVGATFDDELPAGYHHVREATELGRGDDTWDL